MPVVGLKEGVEARNVDIGGGFVEGVSQVVGMRS